MYHTCIYNDDNNIIISIPHDELQLAREGNQALISIAIKHLHKAAEMRAIQKARMMIGVINVSDVCTILLIIYTKVQTKKWVHMASKTSCLVY